MKHYIPELSEQRMVSRAPNRPLNFGTDREYIFSRLRDIEHSFGLQAFPGLEPEQIPARALIHQFILWWRTLEPITEEQYETYGRMPGAIRLIDSYSAWMAERTGKEKL
jgi:hypothetical protein